MRLAARLLLLVAASCSSPPPPTVASAPAASTHRKRHTSHHLKPVDVAAKVDFTSSVIQNARDSDDRVIFAVGDTCKIEVPPSGPELATHEYEEVDCPADYDDEAWDGCPFFLIRAVSGCYCELTPDDATTWKPTACPKLERH